MKRTSRLWAIRAAFASLAFLIVTGCLDERVVQPTPVPLERLTPDYRASFSGLKDPVRVVVRDPAAFATWWKAACLEVPVPDVDFATHTVLVVAMGEQSSGGYSIRVTEVGSEGYGLRALVLSTTPGRGCAVATVMTQPVDFVSVAAHGAAIRFLEERKLTDCD